MFSASLSLKKKKIQVIQGPRPPSVRWPNKVVCAWDEAEVHSTKGQVASGATQGHPRGGVGKCQEACLWGGGCYFCHDCQRFRRETSSEVTSLKDSLAKAKRNAQQPSLSIQLKGAMDLRNAELLGKTSHKPAGSRGLVGLQTIGVARCAGDGRDRDHQRGHTVACKGGCPIGGFPFNGFQHGCVKQVPPAHRFRCGWRGVRVGEASNPGPVQTRSSRRLAETIQNSSDSVRGTIAVAGRA